MQLYYNGFIPFCVYTTYFTLSKSDLLLSHFDILSTYSKPIFIKKLQEVLQRNTVEKTFKNSKGTDYIAQVIPELRLYQLVVL